jgi:UDP-3-O-acyl N-acetylglucosamine deacetylase
MYPPRNQRTIAAPAAVKGVGYWSGQDICVEFLPAEVDTGIVFLRSDLPGRPRIAATVANRTETPLRTTLRSGDAGVDMIEHVMAALAGSQVDNCRVVVDQQEMPGCDGSSLPFVEAILGAGVIEQDAPKRQIVVRQTTRLGDEASWIEARPCCSGKTILQYELDYGADSSIGRQTLEVALSTELFHTGLAPSRTFLLQQEAEALQARGLGRRATCQDLLVFGPDGPIGNQLRFADECVRHKLLDMVGDLALSGCDMIGRFTAYRSGHRLNAEMVRTLLNQKEHQQGFRRCA